MNNSEPTFEFAVVGAGWRTDFFLRIARTLPGIGVSGVVARSAERRAAVTSAWGVATYASIDELLDATSPNYVIASVSAVSMPEVCIELAQRNVPILLETPPAPDLATLVSLYERMAAYAPGVQVAEQYWAQPLHAARQTVIDSGVIGPVDQAHYAVCHGYHAMSLLRASLGIGGENADIRGHRFTGRVVAGPDRAGPPTSEAVVDATTDYAWLDFGDRYGVFEFCLPQYRNWVRAQRVCVRGERGEIVNDEVTWLKDEVTPLRARLERHEAGKNGNLEGLFLKGIQFRDQWVYRNQFDGARLTDEEIAVAQCLVGMHEYVQAGTSFYSLAEACQDQYLALCCEEAMNTGRVVATTAQAWRDALA